MGPSHPGHVAQLLSWLFSPDPPGKPSNLSCLLDLGDYGLTCRWQQGADGHLPTNVMLKCAT